MVTVTGGIATFTNLADNKAETITLQFTSDPVLTPASSSSIVVSPAAPYRLVIYTQPSKTATAGAPFSTQPVVYVEDQYGNLETGDDTTEVTASPRIGNGPLLGGNRVMVTGGIATFGDLHDDKAETIALLFTGQGLIKAQSSAITVNPAAASRLSITAPPKVTTDRPFTIEVTAFDPYGNVATGYRGKVHFSSSDGRAFLPRVYTFVAGDGGVHIFGDGVKLKATGRQSITAIDVSHQSITGSTTVDAASGAKARVVKIAGDGGRVRGQLRESVRRG